MDVTQDKKEAPQALESGLRISAIPLPAAVRSGPRITNLHPSIHGFADRENEARIRTSERSRLARELHDSTSQMLVALELQLMRLKQVSPARRSKRVEAALGELSATIAELHEEVRAIASDRHEHCALARDLSDMAGEFAVRAGLAIQTDIDVEPRIPPEISHALFRVAQEALANVLRHARASNVQLMLAADGGTVKLRIADNGVGFPQSMVSPRAGRGIANMHARLAEVGGRLSVGNLKPGAVITATVDLDANLVG